MKISLPVKKYFPFIFIFWLPCWKFMVLSYNTGLSFNVGIVFATHNFKTCNYFLRKIQISICYAYQLPTVPRAGLHCTCISMLNTVCWKYTIPSYSQQGYGTSILQSYLSASDNHISCTSFKLCISCDVAHNSYALHLQTIHNHP